MTQDHKYYDRAATILGLVLAAIQSSTINYPLLMAGDSGELSKLLKALLFAAIGYVTNKKSKRDDTSEKLIADEIESRFTDVESQLRGKSNRGPGIEPAAKYVGIEPFPGAYPFLGIALALIFCAAAGAQTKAALSQVATPVVGSPAAVVLMPTAKGMQVALFDPSTIVIDTSGPVPIIRIPPPTPVPSPGYTEVFNETARPSANSTTYTLQKPAASATVTALRLYLNGLRLTPGVDYNLAGTLVSFVPGQQPQSGDVLTCDYRYQ